MSAPATTVVPAILPPGYRIAELDDVADRDAILDVDHWAFGYEPADDDVAHLVWPLEPGRSVGVWDERDQTSRRLAAVHSSFRLAMPVPGGARLPTAGLTWLGVHPAHRRRGLSRAMVLTHLARSVARGEVLSALTASEAGIYGRYGYGIATRYARMTLGRGAGLRAVPGAEDVIVDLETLDPEHHTALVDEVHRAVDRPGWITRDTSALRAEKLRDLPSKRRDAERLRIAVARRDGRPCGYATFRRSGGWDDAGLPAATVKVEESAALDAAASRALWGTLTDLDLTTKVDTGRIPTDDPLVHLLTDPRAARMMQRDDIWVRVLDVGAALAARRYQAPVDVVLEVTDHLVPGNQGRWRVRGDLTTATAERTDHAADLALDAADLGAVYLGGTSLGALASAGRVGELTPGTLTPASAAFGWPVAPASSWGF